MKNLNSKNIEIIAEELFEEEEIVVSFNDNVLRLFVSSEGGFQYDIFDKNVDLEELEDEEAEDGGFYEIEEITEETTKEFLEYMLNELL
jgi:hypothetical protein